MNGFDTLMVRNGPCRRSLTFRNVAVRIHFDLSTNADFSTMSSYADIWQGSHDTMLIRTSNDLGALIRDRRIKLGLDQKSLAQKVGVSRQWIVAAEQGKPRAEIGLFLRTIEVLGIRLSTDKESPDNTKNTGRTPPVDIDSIIATARGKRK